MHWQLRVTYLPWDMQCLFFYDRCGRAFRGCIYKRQNFKNIGVTIPVISEKEDLERLKVACRNSDLVIDGLFGTGLNRFVKGIWSDVIDIINTFSPKVLSIDIPSGIDGLSGKVMGNAVKADATVTFYLPKVGMVQHPGASFWGSFL